MSQLRKGRRPDGTRDIEVLGYGDVGRVRHSRLGIAGGGPPVLGALAVGESERTRQLRQQREFWEREAAK